MADKKLITPNFKDVSKEAVQRALANVQGGKQEPLTPPDTARASEDNKGKQYIRWSEQVTITMAYRTVTKNGLMDVVVQQKIRQSDEPKNNGKSFFAHTYYNTGTNISEGHEAMNERSDGFVASLLTATGLMPAAGVLKASLLAKMFPEKGKPGDAPSPLVGKSVIANVVQQIEPAVDPKTNKAKKAKDGSAVMSKRDGAESYLPDVPATDDDDTEE